MPINNDLKPVTLPMDLKFGQEPVTNYINNLESLKIELVDGPTREQAQKIADSNSNTRKSIVELILQLSPVNC